MGTTRLTIKKLRLTFNSVPRHSYCAKLCNGFKSGRFPAQKATEAKLLICKGCH
jgi:hypothetical protein